MITSNTAIKECVCVCVQRSIVETTGGRRWGCNRGGTGFGLFLEHVSLWRRPRDQQLSMCRCKGKPRCLSRQRWPDAGSDNQRRRWPSVRVHILSNIIPAVECVCVCVFLRSFITASLSFVSLQTSITQEKKPQRPRLCHSVIGSSYNHSKLG